ncbi:hypothetical protein FIBSPDRAFT_875671 [Athelia psychrophila]|uniref:Uncharacterized protein n=1 Tax=Athelia psychrophila TaxID=1759441 RepID=A0A167XJ83_9AGAM|nr:hypothetical protein FIBSPDRAFT_875671 [Fibularhizoctonia sp. CBS 109695]
MALKRKRSTTASGDTRQTKRTAEGKARAVEREIIDLTLSSDDEDGDKAANKSGDGQAVPMDVDAEGGANAKDNGLPIPPSLPLPLPPPPSRYGHRKQVEDSASHPEPDNQAELEVACEPTAEPAALPLQEPPLTSNSPHTTSTIAKTEPTDAPLLDSIPPSRPSLTHAHVRLAFKKGEDHLLCLACLIGTSTTTIIPPTNAAAVDHLAAAHGEWVTSLLTQSPVELKGAWKMMKAERGRNEGMTGRASRSGREE